LSNGSIDVQGAFGGKLLRKHLTSNMADEGVIICNFYLEGQVISDDAKRLQAIVATWRQKHKTDTPRLCLNSPGGSFEEGLSIARFLTEEGIGTAIEARATCFSACAIIFMAGTYPWIGQLNRFLNVNGMIGFHAPYLDPSKIANQTYSAAQMVAALNSGIQTVNRMVKFGRERVTHFFDADLLSEMLDRGPGELYAIDTVSKATRFRVALYGGRAPTFSPETLVNACFNYFYGGEPYPLSPQELNRIRATVPQRFPQGVRAEFDAAPKGGSCVIDLLTNGGAMNAWLFHENYLGAHEFAGTTAAILSYWYLFPGATPIVAIPSLSGAR
jgi:hypothetical protein